jgi:IclR family mhp operon transcriptional activator
MCLVEARGTKIPLIWQRPPHFRADLLLTSLGLAYVASCCEEEQRRLLDTSANTADPETEELLRNPTSLRKTFARIRATGYALGSRSYAKRIGADTLWGMGVPVADDERVYGAVNILIIRSAMNEDEGVRRYLPRLQKFASQLMNAIADEKAGFPGAPLFHE